MSLKKFNKAFSNDFLPLSKINLTNLFEKITVFIGLSHFNGGASCGDGRPTQIDIFPTQIYHCFLHYWHSDLY